MFEEQKVLVIDAMKLPEHIKDYVINRYFINNDTIVSLHTEFDNINCTKEELYKYYVEQEFNGSIEEFVEEYGLQLDIWLNEQNVDRTRYDNILLSFSW